MQMPEHNIPTLNWFCQNPVDTMQCWTPSLGPQPHAPPGFVPCTTRFDRLDTSAGTYLAKPHAVASMLIFFVFQLRSQVWEMHL